MLCHTAFTLMCETEYFYSPELSTVPNIEYIQVINKHTIIFV